MQSHLFLFFLLLHSEEAPQHSVVAVSADCSVQSAGGDELLDAITMAPTTTATLTTPPLLRGLKMFH